MWDTVGRRVRTRNTKPEAARLAALHGEAVEAARVEPEHQGVVPKAEKKMGTTSRARGERSERTEPVREEYRRAAGEVLGVPVCRARYATRSKASEWGYGETIQQCLPGFRPGYDCSLRWQSRGSAHRRPRHPQLPCLSQSPAGTGFCSPLAGGCLLIGQRLFPAPTQPISVCQCFHLGVGIKGLE